MKESILRDYFSGEIDGGSLQVFLSEIVGVNELNAESNLACDLTSDFELRLDHLVMICDDFASEYFEASHVTAIAVFLLASDHFDWDSQTPTGAVIAELISDWSTPEIDYPITTENMNAIRSSLTEGRYDRSSLKIEE